VPTRRASSAGLLDGLRLIQPQAQGEPSSTSTPDELAASSRRLGLLSLILGCGAFLAVVLNVLFAELLGIETEAVMGERALCHGLVLALSVAMFALTRSRLEPGFVLRIGLVYEVLGAWGVTLPNLFDQGFLHDHVGRVTWLCIWITLFPLLLPTSTPKKVATALLSASAVPALMLIAWLSGTPTPSLRGTLSSVLPPFICAGLALVTSHFVAQLEARLRLATLEVERLGSYRLVKLLARGGMGEVWRAEHALLARPAAVKLIRTDPQDSETHDRVLARFKREAETLAALNSPHTVSLFDFGVTSAGRPYCVMELLDGIDCEVLVRRFGPLPPARVVHVLLQSCLSLAEAHASGLIHRDVKPANICVCRVGVEYDFVKLLDFGLVSRLREEQIDPETGEPQLAGTPLFMAPEVIRGQDPDPRSDIYALGCVAFWLLTGSYLFDEEEDPQEVMERHLDTLPPALSELGCELPELLEEVIQSCLEKRREDRPQSVEELAAALRSCLPELAPEWTQADARAWWEVNLPPEAWVAAGLDPSRQTTASGRRHSSRSSTAVVARRQ
jgi:eukaryotic-like serine/threonine-protein kinase